MTSHIIKVPLPGLERDIASNQSKVLATGDVVVNGVTIKYKLSLKVESEQVSFTIYMRPQTCDVFPSIFLKSECGFENRNGNICRRTAHQRMYDHSALGLYGVVLYTLSKREAYKIRQSYAIGDDTEAEIHVKLTIIECNVDAQYGRVLRAIYLSQDAGTVDQLIRELDSLRTNCMDHERRYQELSELVETLRSDLQQSSALVTPVSAPTSVPAPAPAPAPTLNDMIARLSLEELTATADKVKERIEDIRRCKICLSSCSTVMLLPCRHTCMCTECNTVHERTGDTCPICRTAISDRIGIYM